MDDNEITQVRAIRHQLSEEHNHDIHQLAAWLRKVEKELLESGKFRREEDGAPVTSAIPDEITQAATNTSN